MNTRIDHNGKLFTDRVRKQRVHAVVQTTTHCLRGYVFCEPDERLKDQLNTGDERFIAIADAEVLAPDGSVLNRGPFLTLNKEHIVWILPAETAAETEGPSAAAASPRYSSNF
jgi:hypothetical protein